MQQSLKMCEAFYGECRDLANVVGKEGREQWMDPETAIITIIISTHTIQWNSQR